MQHGSSKPASKKPCRSCPLCIWHSFYRRALARHAVDATEPPHGAAELTISYVCESKTETVSINKVLVPNTCIITPLDIQKESFMQALQKIGKVHDTQARLLPGSNADWSMVQFGLASTLPKLTSLTVDSLFHVRMESLAHLIHNLADLQVLELNTHGQEHADWTEIALTLASHEGLQRFVLYQSDSRIRGNANQAQQNNNEEDDDDDSTAHVHDQVHSSNPTLDTLGEALLKVRNLKSLQLGKAAADDTTGYTVPFSPELLSALVQHVNLQEISFLYCILTDDQCKGLAVGLQEDCPVENWRDIAIDMSENAHWALDAKDGLERLLFTGTRLSDVSYKTIVSSLAGHPSIQLLNLENTFPDRGINMSSITEWESFNTRKRERTQSILSMLQENHVLHTVGFTLSERDEELIHKVNFCLSLNALGLRRLRSGMSRGVWGMAAVSLSKDPSKLYVLLQQRPDLIIPCNRVLATKPIEKRATGVSRLQQAVSRGAPVQDYTKKDCHQPPKSFIALLFGCLKTGHPSNDAEMSGKLVL
jgi:hypothetical protein